MEVINRQQAISLELEVKQAIRAICQKHNLVPEFGNGKFNANQFNMKVSLKTQGGQKEEILQNQEIFAVYAKQYGLEPTDLGASFKIKNLTYTITGIHPNRPRYPISARASDGKDYKFPLSTVAIILKENRVKA
jgi:hypothetical protein